MSIHTFYQPCEIHSFYGSENSVKTLRQDEKIIELFRTKNFLIFFDPHPYVEGQLIISPKQDYECLGEMPQYLFEELQSVKKAVSDLYKNQGRNCTFYEHHIHDPLFYRKKLKLYALPFYFDLSFHLNSNFTKNKKQSCHYMRKEICRSYDIKNYYHLSTSYLYIKPGNKPGVLYLMEDDGNVLSPGHLRQAIADTLFEKSAFISYMPVYAKKSSAA